VQASDLLAEANNPEGHRVQLGRRAWDHVLDEHVEMQDYLDEVMAAIMSPDHREPDVRPGRERYFRRGGPLRWIRVVTQFAGDVDRVVTAFPQSNDPASRAQR
jgi:hypothetical protein